MRSATQAVRRHALQDIPEQFHEIQAYTACNASHSGCASYGKCDENADNHPTYHHCGSCGQHWIK